MLRIGTFIKASYFDSYVRLQLARPEARNALSDEVVDELNEHLAQVERSQARCVLLTGSDGVFASGGDLKQMVQRTLQSVQRENTLAQWDRIGACSRLMIAAVNGFALGGGLQLAMYCDIRIAAQSAKFGHPELSIGTLPGAGGTQRLTRLVGKSRALDLIMTGRIITAAEAYATGLVTHLCADTELEQRAQTLAQQIGRQPLDTVLALKASLC